MSSEAEKRILDGTSWSDFCDNLKSAGEIVLREGSPMDAFDRAEGFRYLSRLTRVALESYIEAADPRAPVFRRPSHETVKIGADNPDNYYQSAAVSGQYAYRIYGTRETVHYLGFGTYVGNYGSGGRMGQSGYLEGAALEIAGGEGLALAHRDHARQHALRAATLVLGFMLLQFALYLIKVLWHFSAYNLVDLDVMLPLARGVFPWKESGVLLVWIGVFVTWAVKDFRKRDF